MKSIRTTLTLLIFLLGVTACSAIASKSSLIDTEEWWNAHYPDQFNPKKLKNAQTFISVKGNQLVLPSGKPFTLRGVNIADPDKLIKQNQWSSKLFKELQDWGVNTVRLPIHPVSWQQRGKDEYLKIIDQAVLWANEYDMYLIIDWHSIGYLPAELFQHDMYHTTMQETAQFWKEVAFRYQNIPTIAVYELFNEPTDQGGRAGKANWLEWKEVNEALIDIIYAHDKNVIPLVAGFNWAYDLRPIKQNPIEREGIAYAVHPYPQKAKPQIPSKQNFFAMWQEVWGFAAKDYPLIATELGWVNADGYGAHIPVINDGSYGPHIIEFMEQRNISWTAWVFDPNWSPTMISDWEFTPTQQGAFFKKVLLSKQQK
jgi:aryl-phospho-beta-D-glucosidase BglC (GH1 family)